MRKPLNSIFLLYLVMAIPSWELVWDLVHGDRYYAQMMHTSGVVSVYLLVLSLAVTPVVMLAKHLSWGIGFGRWLLVRRRYFGLGSFYYACLHLIHYLREINDIEIVFYEALDIELAIAWIAFVIFTCLAITSNNASMRRLKANWKKLHRLVYPAAILIFSHWILYDFFWDDVLTWAAILIALKAAHIGFNLYRKKGADRRSTPIKETLPQ